MKKLLLLFVIIVTGVIAYSLWQKNSTVVETPKQGSATPVQDKYEWTFTESEADASGAPHTKVTLNYQGKTSILGNYQGSCKEVTTGGLGIFQEKADAGEVARVQCWFAGSGDEIGVFQEGQKLVIKTGELGEAGSNGEPFRGNFKTILSL